MENVGKVMGHWLNPPPACVVMLSGAPDIQRAKALQGEAEISGGGERPRTPPPYAAAPPLTHSHCLLRAMGISLRDGKFPHGAGKSSLVAVAMAGWC